jgi:type IV pilus assembly protein PilC
MNLTYDAIDQSGKSVRDRIEAATVREAVDQLHRRGLFVTEIQEGAAEVRVMPRGSRVVGRVRLPLKTLALFTRQMAMLLRAGSGIVPAIQAVRRQITRPAQAAVLDQLVTDLEEGQTLTDAMGKHPDTFDSVYCAIIAAGEASATLQEMFERLSVIVGKRRAMRNKILGSLAYPTLLIAMCVKIVFVLLFFVLPRFAGMFQQLGVEVPWVTQTLLTVADMLRDHWIFAIALVGAGAGCLIWFLNTVAGRQRLSDFQLYVPLIGRLRARLIQAQILRTMGMLVESRVGVLEALELARRSTKNSQFQRLFDSMEQAVTSGGRLSDAMNSSKLIESYVGQAVHTGEDSGNLGGAMTYCADILDETNAELINTVAKLIEPTILITMGVVVGTVAVSLFVPLFDLTSAMK